MKKYLNIQIEATSVEAGELMIAALSDIGYYAFEQEGPLVNAYITEEEFDENKLKENLPPGTVFNKEIIEEKNWNRQWEQSIEPVIVNRFVAIRPIFHEPIKNVKHDIIITPKMSFGTGHHATTYLMVALMEELDLSGKRVLDFGTGTGVLAIIAEKCGASTVLAIDNDEWSINNALENAAANGCQHISIELRGDIPGSPPADVILANINLNVLIHFAPEISAMLKPGSIFIASGFLFTDVWKMQNIFEEKNVLVKQTRQKDEWAAMLFEKMKC